MTFLAAFHPEAEAVLLGGSRQSVNGSPVRLLLEWRSKRNAVVCLLAVLCLSLSGCGEEQLNTKYGRRTGAGATSVNGTTVLASMFAQQGHDVSSWRRLSPNLFEADVIVWAPDDFESPTNQVRDWFEQWLEQSGTTLIYIHRDYDAAPEYWAKAATRTTGKKQQEFLDRELLAQSQFDGWRTNLPTNDQVDWFTLSRQGSKRKITTLEGPWSQGVNAAKTDIYLYGTLTPPNWSTTLLKSKQDILISEQYTGSGRILIVNNGSLPLNYPLINHEHRKIAGKLISSVGANKKVVFLESDPGGPPVYDEEPTLDLPSGVEAFSVWPLSVILFHLGVLGVIFIALRWPIFGIAKEEERPSAADFGKHVAAIGELMQQTKDQTYALLRVQQYFQVVKGETISVSLAASEPPFSSKTKEAENAEQTDDDSQGP